MTIENTVHKFKTELKTQPHNKNDMLILIADALAEHCKNKLTLIHPIESDEKEPDGCLYVEFDGNGDGYYITAYK